MVVLAEDVSVTNHRSCVHIPLTPRSWQDPEDALIGEDLTMQPAVQTVRLCRWKAPNLALHASKEASRVNSRQGGRRICGHARPWCHAALHGLPMPDAAAFSLQGQSAMVCPSLQSARESTLARGVTTSTVRGEPDRICCKDTPRRASCWRLVAQRDLYSCRTLPKFCATGGRV